MPDGLGKIVIDEIRHLHKNHIILSAGQANSHKMRKFHQNAWLSSTPAIGWQTMSNKHGRITDRPFSPAISRQTAISLRLAAKCIKCIAQNWTFHRQHNLLCSVPHSVAQLGPTIHARKWHRQRYRNRWTPALGGRGDGFWGFDVGGLGYPTADRKVQMLHIKLTLPVDRHCPPFLPPWRRRNQISQSMILQTIDNHSEKREPKMAYRETCWRSSSSAQSFLNNLFALIAKTKFFLLPIDMAFSQNLRANLWCQKNVSTTRSHAEPIEKNQTIMNRILIK